MVEGKIKLHVLTMNWLKMTLTWPILHWEWDDHIQILTLQQWLWMHPPDGGNWWRQIPAGREEKHSRLWVRQLGSFVANRVFILCKMQQKKQNNKQTLETTKSTPPLHYSNSIQKGLNFTRADICFIKMSTNLWLPSVLVLGQVDPGDGAKWPKKLLQVCLTSVLRQIGHTNSSIVISCRAQTYHL